MNIGFKLAFFTCVILSGNLFSQIITADSINKSINQIQKDFAGIKNLKVSGWVQAQFQVSEKRGAKTFDGGDFGVNQFFHARPAGMRRHMRRCASGFDRMPVRIQRTPCRHRRRRRGACRVRGEYRSMQSRALAPCRASARPPRTSCTQ